jgi:hypothetical protein
MMFEEIGDREDETTHDDKHKVLFSTKRRALIDLGMDRLWRGFGVDDVVGSVM